MSLAEIIADGLGLQDTWVTLRLWNDSHAEVDVIASARANIYMELEIAFVRRTRRPESQRINATGSLFEGSKCNQLLHGEIIAKLNQSAQAVRVLNIKTGMTIPYTSVFFEFDCGYWDAEAEGRVRRLTAGSRSKVD